MFVHPAFFVWHAPWLSEQESLNWGERILRLGPEHFLWQFRKFVGQNPMSAPDPNLVGLDLESGPPKPRLDSLIRVVQVVIHPLEYLLVAVYLLFSVGCVLYVGDISVLPYLVGAGLLIWGIWLGSLFIGFSRYRRWIEGLQAKYMAGSTKLGR